MALEINLQSRASRIVFCILALLLGIWLIKIVTVNFVIGAMADRRLTVTREMLEQTAKVFPASARILSRLAEFEAQGTTADAASAEIHIKDAIRRSPRDFRYQLLLGEINDTRNNTKKAENAYREAVRLAPQFSEAHWRLANVLLREGLQQEAYEHFRIAASLNPKFLPTSLDLVWQTSNKNFDAVRHFAHNQPLAQIKLANLLAAEGRLPEAIEMFSQIDNSIAAKSLESSRFIDKLAKDGYPNAAFNLWKELIEKNAPLDQEKSSGVWNPSFEQPATTEAEKPLLRKFDWQLASSDYARAAIDSRSARTGAQALAIEFTGRDTTKLTNEAKQLIVVQPGGKYRVTFYAKSSGLKTPEGPKVSISSDKGEILASSAAIGPEQSDWTKLAFDFAAPNPAAADGVLLILSITRKPKYVYDEPTRGTVLFDDFSVTRL